MCLDLNSMELIWVQDILDDSNSTPVLSIEDGHLYLYVSTSFRLDGEVTTRQRYRYGRSMRRQVRSSGRQIISVIQMMVCQEVSSLPLLREKMILGIICNSI